MALALWLLPWSIASISISVNGNNSTGDSFQKAFEGALVAPEDVFSIVITEGTFTNSDSTFMTNLIGTLGHLNEFIVEENVDFADNTIAAGTFSAIECDLFDIKSPYCHIIGEYAFDGCIIGTFTAVNVTIVESGAFTYSEIGILTLPEARIAQVGSFSRQYHKFA